MREVQYSEAPSGFVRAIDFKEPLMKYDGGFGFRGTLFFDKETDKAQCHICGGWFKYLPHHLHKEHLMTAAEYKEEVGLYSRQGLISETTRQKLLENGIERFSHLRPGKKHTEESKKKISDTLKKSSSKTQWQNTWGTCREQLLDRLKKRRKELNRPLTIRDIDFILPLNREFGSFNKALQFAGLEWRRPGVTIDSPAGRPKKHKEEFLLWSLREVGKIEGRTPSKSDMIRHGYPRQEVFRYRFGSWKNALIKAGFNPRVFHHCCLSINKKHRPDCKTRSCPPSPNLKS